MRSKAENEKLEITPTHKRGQLLIMDDFLKSAVNTTEKASISAFKCCGTGRIDGILTRLGLITVSGLCSSRHLWIEFARSEVTDLHSRFTTTNQHRSSKLHRTRRRFSHGAFQHEDVRPISLQLVQQALRAGQMETLITFRM